MGEYDAAKRAFGEARAAGNVPVSVNLRWASALTAERKAIEARRIDSARQAADRDAFLDSLQTVCA